MYTIGIKKLRIEKRSLRQWLTLYMLIMPLFLNVLTGFLGIPGIVKYTVDVAWLGLFLLTVQKKRINVKERLIPLVSIVLVFLLYTLVVYGFRFQSLMYYLWGARNYFRFYVAFFAFVTFFDGRSLEKIFDFLEVVFWINVVVSLIQFFVFGYKYDYLGGIFGVQLGANGNTLLFFCTVLTRSILLMMLGQKKLISCVMQLVAASIIAALAELKAFFLILLVILIMAAAITNFSWRKCVLILATVFCLFVGSYILAEVFGHNSRLSMERVIDLIFSKNYSSAKDMGRLTAIPIISKRFLSDPLSKCIGLGLGNCDTASFDFLNTPFFRQYSYLNYSWFSTAFLYLETGFVGMTLYLMFFIVCMVAAWKQLHKPQYSELYSRYTMIYAVLCVILMIYNSSLRTDIGYLAYFSLATAFIARKENVAGKAKEHSEDTARITGDSINEDAVASVKDDLI